MAKSTPPKPGLVVKDTGHAPIIYFDVAPTFSNGNGVIGITLAAGRHLMDGTQVTNDVVAVAYLRCSVPVATALKTALERALLLGAKAEGKIN